MLPGRPGVAAQREQGRQATQDRRALRVIQGLLAQLELLEQQVQRELPEVLAALVRRG